MIKDIALAPTGHQKIAWVKEHMPLLNILNERYAEKKIFDGLNINCGANVVVTGSNPLSTQDDVAAALADSGITVFATHACSQEEYDLRADSEPYRRQRRNHYRRTPLKST